MDEDKKSLLSRVEEKSGRFFDYAKSIWGYAELGCREVKSSGLLVRVLKENGFEVQEGISGMPTAFKATWGTGSPTIGFSLEYDALPGLSPDSFGPGHGCGHNLLGTGNLLAAVTVKEWLSCNALPGKILVFGTPAEELCIGKPFMAQNGYFEGIDAVLDWHPWTGNIADADTCNAYFNIKYHFYGRNSHGNSPWMGRSALDSAVLMGHAIEMLREHIPPGNPGAANTINYTFSDVGPRFPSVVPDHATIWVIGRITDSETMEEVIQRVHRCAEGAGLATGTTWKMEFKTASHEKIPNSILASVMHGNFAEIGGPSFTTEEQARAREVQRQMNAPELGLDTSLPPMRETSTILTDNSEYSWFAPFAMVWVTLAPAGFGWHNKHIAAFAVSSAGRKAMTTAAKVIAASCADLFRDPELLLKAKQEWKERLGGRAFTPLIPEGTPVPSDLTD